MGADYVAAVEGQPPVVSRAEIDDAIRARWPYADVEYLPGVSSSLSDPTVQWKVEHQGRPVQVTLDRERWSVQAKNEIDVIIAAAVWLRQLVGPRPRVLVIAASSGVWIDVPPGSSESDVRATFAAAGAT